MADMLELVLLQRYTGTAVVLERGIPGASGLARLQEADRTNRNAGNVAFLRPDGDVLARVATELARARSLHGRIASAHEGLAVIREEYLEVEREVFQRQPDRAALRKELIQLAAMAVRMVEDLEL